MPLRVLLETAPNSALQSEKSMRKGPTQTISCEDIQANMLPHGINGGNMIENKMLPTRLMQEVKLPENGAEHASDNSQYCS